MRVKTNSNLIVCTHTMLNLVDPSSHVIAYTHGSLYSYAKLLSDFTSNLSRILLSCPVSFNSSSVSTSCDNHKHFAISKSNYQQKKQAQTVGLMRLPKAQFRKQKLLLGNQNTKILLSEQWETFQWATKPCPGKLVKRSRTVSFFIHHKNLHVHLYERCKQSASLQVK